MKIFCLLLVIAIFVGVLYGGCKAFDIQLYLGFAQAFSHAFTNVPQSLANIWTHDYFNVNTGISWVDSILGDGIVEGIVNCTYRMIDTFKVLGTALKDWVIGQVVLNPINPIFFTSIEDDIYRYSPDDYIYTDSNTPEEETVVPTVPNGN